MLDHHRVETAPPAVAHVNPNQPGDGSGLGHLCAAGVTFLFLVGLNRHLRETNFYRERELAEPDLRLFLDLVGLATICDVVPLKDLNRAFVRFGLSQIAPLMEARPPITMPMTRTSDRKNMNESGATNWTAIAASAPATPV